MNALLNRNGIQSQTDTDEPISLYIHWPFCASKCPYCDFNSHVNNAVDQDQWRKAMLTELEYVGSATKGRPLKSVFFGGGTPSLMPPQTVQVLIDALSLYWKIDGPIEITLEGNPNSIEVNQYKDFKQAGINRVSVGIQSLRPESLSFLGRLHDVDEAKRALEITGSLFDRSSFDLIYALPNQTLCEWQAELSEAIELAQGHLSLYQLIIEPGTAFYTRYHRGEFQLPSEEASADMFQWTREFMASHGYDLYEVSNFAKPGHECQHNLTYWLYNDYACIGPGAHGRVTLAGSEGPDKADRSKYAIRNHRAPDVWLNAVEQHGHGQKKREFLPHREQIIEHLLMNLRVPQGIDRSQFQNKHGCDVLDLFPADSVEHLQDAGYVSISDRTLAVTQDGLLRLDGITSKLVTSMKDGII